MLRAHFSGLRPRRSPVARVGEECERCLQCIQSCRSRDTVCLYKRFEGLRKRKGEGIFQGVPVHAVFCQAQLHMTEIFAPAAVDRVYINFPDPWFKRRHHDRRMVDAALADGIARVGRPGGEVFVQSDVWDIALDAMATFERDERFANLAGEWTFWRGGNPYGVRSWREQNAEETGLAIWRLLYRRA